jgi:mono/diheme cytochrome c family protein
VKVPRQLVIWATAALVSLLALGIIVQRQHRDVQRRVAVQVATTPQSGAAVFRGKGCANCHGPSGAGTSSGPSLRDSRSLTSLPRLVTAMWNHAPRMWEVMTEKRLPYPTLSYEETSQLVTYLYISGYADNHGDVERGEQLFLERKCSECHSRDTSAENAPSLIAISDANDPLSWTQALWNHAPAMQRKMQSTGMAWPKFQASDMRDLFAYVQHIRNQPDNPPDISGDPDRGWHAVS